MIYQNKFLGMLAKLQNVTVSFIMSVCPSAWKNSALTEQISMTFEYVLGVPK